jgi:NitT/TauT family transport system ATP-binding protein
MPTPVVSVEALGKRFDDQRAIENLSFEVNDGEFVAIVGPSGCGKSTTLRIVAGLASPSAGNVRVYGAEVTRPLQGAAMVFQAPVLLPWRRTLDNILLTAEMRGRATGAHRERAIELARLAGLEGFERHFPHELSGGMQQRVSLCRALLLDPALLLMDEPFGALDVMTREKMGFELQRIWTATKNTVLFVTHSISEAILLSDRILVMSARPGRTKADIPVELARPRTVETLTDPRFAKLALTVREQIEMS